MRLFYSLIQLFDTCYSHFWSFFSPHFFLISRETNTFCWDFFFDDCQCTEIGRRVGCFVALASYTLSYLFNRFLWKYVKLKTSILHCTTCNRQQNEQMTNERKKNYEFSCKEFFPCRCIHWKSCLSNSFDTYECFENMFQQRMLYTYIYIWLQAKMGISFVRVSWIHSHKIFHSIQMPWNARVPYLNRVSLDQIGYLSNQRKIIFQTRNLFIGISLGNNVQYKMK